MPILPHNYAQLSIHINIKYLLETASIHSRVNNLFGMCRLASSKIRTKYGQLLTGFSMKEQVQSNAKYGNI